MSREGAKGNEGEPTWWTPEFRDRVLNASVDLEDLLRIANWAIKLRDARKARLKEAEKAGMSQEFIAGIKKLLADDPTEMYQVAKDVLTDFGRQTSGLTKGSLRLILPLLWKRAQETITPRNFMPYTEMMVHKLLLLASETNQGLQPLFESVGIMPELDEILITSRRMQEQGRLADGISQVDDQLIRELQEGKI